ncbi:hypothetical protein BaRGS_00016757, partial [Batillaria attramentaria]
MSFDLPAASSEWVGLRAMSPERRVFICFVRRLSRDTRAMSRPRDTGACVHPILTGSAQGLAESQRTVKKTSATFPCWGITDDIYEAERAANNCRLNSKLARDCDLDLSFRSNVYHNDHRKLYERRSALSCKAYRDIQGPGSICVMESNSARGGGVKHQITSVYVMTDVTLKSPGGAA